MPKNCALPQKTPYKLRRTLVIDLMRKCGKECKTSTELEFFSTFEHLMRFCAGVSYFCVNYLFLVLDMLEVYLLFFTLIFSTTHLRFFFLTLTKT